MYNTSKNPNSYYMSIVLKGKRPGEISQIKLSNPNLSKNKSYYNYMILNIKNKLYAFITYITTLKFM